MHSYAPGDAVRIGANLTGYISKYWSWPPLNPGFYAVCFTADEIRTTPCLLYHESELPPDPCRCLANHA